jgi:hypothetical protein
MWIGLVLSIDKYYLLTSRVCTRTVICMFNNDAFSHFIISGAG